MTEGKHRKPHTPEYECLGLSQEHLDMIADGTLRVGKSFGPSHEDDAEDASN